jgi:hypothetical protein
MSPTETELVAFPVSKLVSVVSSTEVTESRELWSLAEDEAMESEETICARVTAKAPSATTATPSTSDKTTFFHFFVFINIVFIYLLIFTN